MGDGQDSTILSLIHAAKYREAFRLAEEAGVKERWKEGEPANLYGRLIRGLGARREATVLHWRAWRRDRDAGGLALQVGAHVHSRRGPLEAWKFYETQCAERKGAFSDQEYGELLAQMAFVAGCWRDFDKADALLDEASAIAPTSSWVWVKRCSVARERDEFDRAMEYVDHVLGLRPYYRPATEWRADLLRDMGRDDEAVEYIEEALGHVDSPSLAAILSSIHSEREDHQLALKAIDRYEELSPLADKDIKKWIAGRRADLHYLNGDHAVVPDFAKASGNKVLKQIAAKLAEKPGAQAERVRLPVPFIQQHHMTCGPATMASLCAFWERPAEHLEIVEAICYDGTPAASERLWTEGQGYVAREFKVDWEITRTLIDRGVPFTLTTTEPTSAHLQAVIGYDAVAETIIIRDPTAPHYSEAVGEAFLKGYEAYGPRGFLFIPKEEAHRLEGLDELPEEAFYDLRYKLELALRKHDRAAAGGFADAMVAIDPEHRMAYEARATLAYYDGDKRAGANATEALWKMFPKSGAMLLRHFNALNSLSLTSEQKPLAEKAVRRKRPHPVFYTVHANLISDDSRRAAEASYYYRKAIRRTPYDAHTYKRLGHVVWGAGDHARAMPLYRIAATLARTDESNADTFFTASRHVGGTEEALAFLRTRFDSLGQKDAGPVITLAEAYQRLSRDPEAVAVIEEGLALRPDDGDLLLFASTTYQRAGQPEKAVEMHSKAEGKCDQARWSRRAAQLAGLRGDHEARRRHWGEVLESDPLAVDAHRALASLAAQDGAIDDDCVYLAEQCAKHPFYQPLHEDYISALRYEKRREEALVVIEHLLGLNADNHWARRERIITLTQLDRFDDALPDVEELLRRDPDESTTHGVAGTLFRDRGDREKATEHFRRAIELDVDYDFAIRNYVLGGENTAEKRERIDFVKRELERQPIFGDSVLAFRDVASGVLSPEEMTAVYEEIAKERPDLWQSWSVRITDLAERGEIDQALELANGATERFPLLPRVWTDLANAHRLHGNREGRAEALRRAIELNPAWAWGRRELGIALDELGEREEAIAVLERCVADSPLDAPNHTVLADMQKRAGDDAGALAGVKRAVELDPSFDWAWNKWYEWTEGEDGAREEILAAALKRIERAPEDLDGWSLVARMRSIGGDPEAACETLREGLRSNPTSEWLRVDLARRLFALGRFDEARAVCTEDLPEGMRRKRLTQQAAQIDWDCGKRKEAIETMEQLLTEHTDDVDGVALLADWYDEEQDNEKYEQCARRLVELSPAEARSHGFLGDALQRLDRKTEAAEALEHAFELDGDYRFGAENALLLRIEEKDFEKAKATLARLDHLSPNPRNLVFALKIAFGENRFDDSMSLFGQIVRADSDDEWMIQEAVASIPKSEWAEATIVDLEAALRAGEVRNPRAGVVFVDFQVNKGKATQLANLLSDLALTGPLGTRTWHHFITKLGENDETKLLGKLMKSERARLTASTDLWGAVGHALFEQCRHNECAEWMKQWRGRDELEGWMLWNYSLAAAGKKAPYSELRAVSQFAAYDIDRDRSTSSHLGGLAFYDVLDGDFAAARERMAGINDAELGAAWAFCCELARTSIALKVDGDPAAALKHLKAARAASENWHDKSWSRRHWVDWLKVYRDDLNQQPILKMELKAAQRSRKWFKIEEDDLRKLWIVGAILIYALLRGCSGD